MADSGASKYWLDIVTEDILSQYPEGDIVVSSGISPSGSYHIGHFREILTADALYLGLKAKGRKVKHVHFVDDFDPLRRRYPFLPDTYEKEVGKPYWMIPDPQGDCHESYADHFFAEFKEVARRVGIEMEVLFSHQQYMAGKFNALMEIAIDKAADVRGILNQFRQEDLPSDWTPVQKLNEQNQFINIGAGAWAEAKQSISEGKVKLSWRLDWPARWNILGVTVEPFGREHATVGGSYETGALLAEKVFGNKPPYPVPYDTINLKGETKKMSSSLGNLVSLKDALEILPPEVLRYFVLKSRPSKKIHFDTAEGLYHLLDEFSQIESDQKHEFRAAYNLANQLSTKRDRTISSIPFKHLVSVYQASRHQPAKALELLKRTGYEAAVKNEAEIISKEFEYVDKWLKKYAPDEIKFEIADKLPKLKLTDQQVEFLKLLANELEAKSALEAKDVHETIYKLKDECKLQPAEAFRAIYQVILSKDYGPKAGWFISILDKDWLINRLKLEA